MVVIKPWSMPKLSLRTFATGARQLVVQEALEMMWCFAGSYLSWLIPKATVMSGFFAGAEISTFFAPAVRFISLPSTVLLFSEWRTFPGQVRCTESYLHQCASEDGLSRSLMDTISM